MSDLRIAAASAADPGAVPAFSKTAAEGRGYQRRPAGRRATVRPRPARAAARRDRELGGTVTAGFDGRPCHLYRLAVHPEHRGQGVGAALPAAAEERFCELGGRWADAMVLDRDTPAHAARQAGGYHPEGHWARWGKPLRG